MKKLSKLLLTLILLISIVPVTKAYADDIDGIKLEGELREAVEKEILFGYGEGVYKPGNKVSRGEFANFITRALHLPEAEPRFPDVSKTSKLAPGINSAAQAGIVKGLSNGNFGPDQEISREQMVIMIKNALDYQNVNVEYEVPTILSDFNAITSSTSRIAIANSVSLNITIGFPNTDGKTYRFAPGNTATRAEAAAFIIRMIHAIEEIEEPTPVPGEEPFAISSIDSDRQLQEATREFKTYDEAVTQWDKSGNQVVTYMGKVIKMSTGLALGSPSINSSSNVTELYKTSTLTGSSVTYVQRGEEMKYLSSDENYVEVYIGGRTAYARQSDVELVPTKMVEKQNYYTVNASNELVLNVSSKTSNMNGAVVIGKAPSFLKQGNKYYSWDGNKFFTNSSGLSTSYVGQSYSYFQYLQARVQTSYTAEELNQYINKRLLELEKTGLSKYKNASTTSKLIGIGTYLKEIETTHRINALLILAMAFHEGDYGMSEKAFKYNNVFGIGAYDSTNTATPYPSVQASVDGLVNNYLGKNYIPPTAAFANGAVPGNKLIGFNVKYASDAYWGAKVASHMYRIDKELGGKDYGKYTTFGILNTDGTAVRSAATTSANLIYRYTTKNKPVIILGEEKASDGYIWYKVNTDDKTTTTGYIRSDLVDKITVN